MVFVFSWNPLALLLVPMGAAVGYLVSLAPPRVPQERAQSERIRLARVSARIGDYLGHPNVLVRFLSLMILGTVLFLVAWTTGYYLLPEGAFHTGAEAQLASRGLSGIAETAFDEASGIFLHNLLPVVLIVLGNIALRVNGIPIGYVVPLFNLVGYGLFIGTNSFLIPYPERLAPTFAILERSGPYEMTALVMVAAATAAWSRYAVRRLFRTEPERLPGPPRVTWQQVAFLLLGIALLAGAAWREGMMIVER
ncbi:MAG: hypothetical protein ABR510_10900 [Trueperaceae bacterium]